MSSNIKSTNRKSNRELSALFSDSEHSSFYSNKDIKDENQEFQREIMFNDDNKLYNGTSDENFSDNEITENNQNLFVINNNEHFPKE